MGVDFSFGVVEEKAQLKALLKLYADKNRHFCFRFYHLYEIIEGQLGEILRKFLKKKYSFDFYYKACGDYTIDARTFNPAVVLEELEAIREVLIEHKESFISYSVEFDKKTNVNSHFYDIFFKGKTVDFAGGINECEMYFLPPKGILAKIKYVAFRDYMKKVDIRKWESFTCQIKSKDKTWTGIEFIAEPINITARVLSKPYIEEASRFLYPLISVCKYAIENKLMVRSSVG